MVESRAAHRVKLLARAEAGFGQAATWNTYATVWAKIAPLSGRQAWAAQQFVSEVSHTITIRYRQDVQARHRIQFGGRNFEIKAVLNPEERNIRLDLLCEEINDGAALAS